MDSSKTSSQTSANADTDSILETLTVVVLTLNEAERIERCLESVLFAKSVVILDSYSEDQTLERAAQFWIAQHRAPEDLLLVSTPWKGFVQTRNASLDWVKTPWVLWIDADEWVSPELRAELNQALNPQAVGERLPSYSIAKIPRQSFFMGRAIKHGGWFPDRKTRLAKTLNCRWVEGPNGSDVHEDLKVLYGPQERGELHSVLYHEPFRNFEEQAETNDRYSSLLAQGLAKRWIDERKRPPTQTFVLFKSAIKFVENYIWKLGCLDGKAGLLIALGSAKSLRMRFHKASRLTKNSVVPIS